MRSSFARSLLAIITLVPCGVRVADAQSAGSLAQATLRQTTTSRVTFRWMCRASLR